MDIEAVDIVQIAGTAGALVLAIAAYRGKKQNTKANTYNELSEAIGNLSSQLKGAIERITILERERDHWKNTANALGQKLAKVETYIHTKFGVRIDTDDLNTPPPHVIPPDASPPSK